MATVGQSRFFIFASQTVEKLVRQIISRPALLPVAEDEPVLPSLRIGEQVGVQLCRQKEIRIYLLVWRRRPSCRLS